MRQWAVCGLCVYKEIIMKILVLGASGMLGHMLFAELLERGLDVFGTTRSPMRCCDDWQRRLISGVDVSVFPSVLTALDTIKPDVLINAVGLIRHLPEGKEILPCLTINATFPHLLQQATRERGMRLIHYSTDCVFDGKANRPYTEQDRPTASDVYGLTKFLGEVSGLQAVTIRTSIIGPELRGKHSLIEWFLAQHGSVRGYTGAIYTGLPTSEHARILAEYILPHSNIEGLWQVAAAPISKYELLRLVASVYKKTVEIVPDNSVQEDKRLSCEAFNRLTGYEAPTWPEMIRAMREAQLRIAEKIL